MISDDFFLKTIIVPFLIQQVGYSAELTTLGDATTSVTSKNSNSILPQLWSTYAMYPNLVAKLNDMWRWIGGLSNQTY